MIRSQQIRAARVMLDISQAQLADMASIGIATIKRVEAARGRIAGNAETLWRIQRALENAGVIFLPEDERGGPGVRLKQGMAS